MTSPVTFRSLRPVYCLWLFAGIPAYAGSTVSAHSSEDLLPKLASLPLAFEAADADRYICRIPGMALSLSSGQVLIDLFPRASVSLPAARSITRGKRTPAAIRLLGASRDARAEPLDRLPGTSNYLLGRDRTKWRTGIARFGRVRYHDIYPGIDAVYYGNGRELEYDLVVHPGANPGSAVFAYSGVDEVAKTGDGALSIRIGRGLLLQKAPVAYQELHGRRIPVESEYRIDARRKRVRIAVGTYDRTRDLVIDPVLQYGTFLGGRSYDVSNAIAVDSGGSAWVTGYTQSPDFPVAPSAYLRQLRGLGDAFVARLNSTGTAFDYVTYLGGSGDERGTGIAVDASGQAYVTGVTNSSDFPVRSVPSLGGSASYGGGASDAFISVLNATGTDIVFSFYLGGGDLDGGSAIALDSDTSIYVAGYSASLTLPGVSSPQSSNAGGYDAFVYKYSRGGALVFGTFFGGSLDDLAYGLAVTPSGRAYVTGETTSSTLPAASFGYQPSAKGGRDAFLFSISSSSVFDFATFIGGTNTDSGQSVAILPNGSVAVAGFTNSPDFPVSGDAAQASNAGAYDAFVSVLDGSRLLYSTYLGGTALDVGYSVVADGNGNIYAGGYSASANFLSTFPTRPQQTNSTFVVELGQTGTPPTPEVTIVAASAPLYKPVFAAYFPAFNDPAALNEQTALAIRPSTTELYIAASADSALNLGLRPVLSFRGGLADAFIGKFGTSTLALAVGFLTTVRNGSPATTVPPGSAFFLPVTITNTASLASGPATISVQLPAGFNFFKCEGPVSCTASGNIIVVTASAIAAGQNAQFTLIGQAGPQPGAPALIQASLVSTAPVPFAPAAYSATLAQNFGAPPPFTTDPAGAINCGSASIGQSATCTLDIMPNGRVTLSVNTYDANGQPSPVFSLDKNYNSVDADENSPPHVSVIFTPGSVGPVSGSLEIVANNVTDPHNLTGTGVSAAATLTARPASLSFSYTPGAPAPGFQTLHIDSNPQGVPISFGPTPPWLSVSPMSGTGGQDFSVAVNVAGLTASQSANLTVTSPTATVPLIVPVTLTLASAPVINNFTATPSIIDSGQKSTLSWNVTGATSLRIDPTIGVVTGTTRDVSPAVTTTYTLTASNGSSSVSRTATVTVRSVNPDRPVVNNHGVVTNTTSTEQITPLGNVSIYGSKFITAADLANLTAGERAGGKSWDGITLHTTLAGTSVTVAGRPAYLLFINSNFINIEVPDTTARGMVPVVVSNSNGVSDPVMVLMADYAPEFKEWNNDQFPGYPQHYVAAQHVDNSVIAPVGMFPGSSPARPGETISLWGLGFGPASTSILAGTIASGTRLAHDPQVAIGGRGVALPYGAYLLGVGLYQANIVVPEDLADGDYPVTAIIGGVQVFRTVKLAVKR